MVALFTAAPLQVRVVALALGKWETCRVGLAQGPRPAPRPGDSESNFAAIIDSLRLRYKSVTTGVTDSDTVAALTSGRRTPLTVTITLLTRSQLTTGSAQSYY